MIRLLNNFLLILMSIIPITNSMDKDKICPPFQCPRKTYPVPKTRLKITSSGCADLSGVMMMSMGNDQSSDPLGPCCDQFHACYQICGSVEHICKEKFLKCMDNTCANAGPQAKAKCEQEVSLKKMMVQYSGCSKYDLGQKAGCECVKERDLAPARKTVLKSFYKSYSSDGVDDAKIDTLVAKVDSPVKFSALMQKLVAKYPKSIKKVKDKGSQFMDEFMKKQEKEDKVKKESTATADDTATFSDEADDDTPVEDLDEL